MTTERELLEQHCDCGVRWKTQCGAVGSAGGEGCGGAVDFTIYVNKIERLDMRHEQSKDGHIGTLTHRKRENEAYKSHTHNIQHIKYTTINKSQ